MKTIVCALAAITLSLVSVSASSKTQTIKVEIVGPGLVEPLVITNREILDRFSIWNGPGVGVSGQPVQLQPSSEQQTGAFIDWSRGTVSQPPGLRFYTITFHQGGREPVHDWHRRYVVTYACGPDTKGGYIYLPGPTDGNVYERNVFSIVHGVEGNWFYASEAWEQSVRSLIQQRVAASNDTTASTQARSLQR